MCFGFAGFTQIACTSSCVTSAASVWNVLPPSIVMCMPTPPRYTTSGFVGSIVIWLKYIGRGFALFTFFHVVPASSER